MQNFIENDIIYVFLVGINDINNSKNIMFYIKLKKII